MPLAHLAPESAERGIWVAEIGPITQLRLNAHSRYA
jgi:hypothetical protein